MGFGHIQARQWRRRRGAPAPAPTAPAAVLETRDQRRRLGREIGLDRDHGDHGRGGRALGVEQVSVALHVERHRYVVVGDRRGDEHVGAPGPGPGVRGHGQVHLERDGAVGLARQIGRGPPGATRQRREGEPAVGGEEALERQLMLAVGRAIELGAYARAERGVAERESEPTCQLFRGSGGNRGSSTGRACARARRGARPRCAIGTGEPAQEQRERGGRGQA